MDVTVTQFMRPNGRRQTYQVTVPDDCAEGHERMKACGAEITSEQFMSGKAATYIGHPEVDADFKIEITGAYDTSAAQAALEKVIRGFDTEAFEAWREKMKELDADSPGDPQ